MDPGERCTIKQLFVTWLPGLSPGQPEPAYILNKMAQLLGLVFTNEFLTEWPSFFTDLISLVPTGGVVVLDVVFRVLTAIHELEVDRELQQLHSAGELARNTHIKGAMRAHAVDVIADTWYGMSPIGPCYLHPSCSLLFHVSRLFVCSEGQPSREHPVSAVSRASFLAGALLLPAIRALRLTQPRPSLGSRFCSRVASSSHLVTSTSQVLLPIYVCRGLV